MNGSELARVFHLAKRPRAAESAGETRPTMDVNCLITGPQNNALHLTIAAATRWAALAGERECCAGIEV